MTAQFGRIVLLAALGNQGICFDAQLGSKTGSDVRVASEVYVKYDRELSALAEALAPFNLEPDRHWTARDLALRPIAMAGTGLPRQAAGSSFDLGLVLLTASRLAHLPVPEGVVASAAVDSGGGLKPVDGLAPKLRAWRVARKPGARPRLVVAHDQPLEPLYAAAKDHDLPRRAILRLRTVEEAVEAVLGDEVPPELSDEALRRSRGQRLVGITLTELRSGRFESLERTLAWLRERVEGESPLAFELDLARGVAARHRDNKGNFPTLR